MLGVKHPCQFTVGLVSSLMALGAGVSGLTMAMEGNHWPGVAMMVATALLLSVAEDAFGRMRQRGDYHGA